MEVHTNVNYVGPIVDKKFTLHVFWEENW